MTVWPMYKKELRENWLYALGTMMAIVLVMDYFAHRHDWTLLGLSSTVWEHRPDNSANRYQDQTSLPVPSTEWAIICVSLSAIVAVKLVLSEHVRRTWPLLMQLPAKRDSIVWAKFAAGATLLAGVLVSPALLLAARLSMPGVWAGPVYLRGFLPLAVWIAAALFSYELVFLTAFAPLRWYATRGLILFAGAPLLGTAILILEAQRTYTPDRAFTQWNGIWILAGAVLLAAGLCAAAIRQTARTREF